MGAHRANVNKGDIRCVRKNEYVTGHATGVLSLAAEEAKGKWPQDMMDYELRPKVVQVHKVL